MSSSGCYVICKECGEKHSTENVEFIDCSEGDRGQDVLIFYCPKTAERTESNVYKGYFE